MEDEAGRNARAVTHVRMHAFWMMFTLVLHLPQITKGWEKETRSMLLLSMFRKFAPFFVAALILVILTLPGTVWAQGKEIRWDDCPEMKTVGVGDVNFTLNGIDGAYFGAPKPSPARLIEAESVGETQLRKLKETVAVIALSGDKIGHGIVQDVRTGRGQKPENEPDKIGFDIEFVSWRKCSQSYCPPLPPRGEITDLSFTGKVKEGGISGWLRDYRNNNTYLSVKAFGFCSWGDGGTGLQLPFGEIRLIFVNPSMLSRAGDKSVGCALLPRLTPEEEAFLKRRDEVAGKLSAAMAAMGGDVRSPRDTERAKMEFEDYELQAFWDAEMPKNIRSLARDDRRRFYSRSMSEDLQMERVRNLTALREALSDYVALCQEAWGN